MRTPTEHARNYGATDAASVTHHVEQRLKLKVNREKSVVDGATKRPLLGLRFAYRRDEVRVLVGPKRVKGAKDRLRQLTSHRWGVSMERRIKEINRSCYARADTPSPFRKLDKWLRRRLRQVRWKEWKRVRSAFSRALCVDGCFRAGVLACCGLWGFFSLFCGAFARAWRAVVGRA